MSLFAGASIVTYVELLLWINDQVKEHKVSGLKCGFS